MATKTITIGNRVYTLREFEIIKKLMTGISRKEVAAQLGMSPGTLNTHIKHIYAKAGISKITLFINWGTDHGFDTLGNYNPID